MSRLLNQLIYLAQSVLLPSFPSVEIRVYLQMGYGKIPKISPGAYKFEGPFWGAYRRNEICVSKSIRLALWLEVNVPFLLCLTLYLRTIFQVQAPEGLIFEGAI